MNINNDNRSMVDWAQQYAARGWHVFPVPPGTKKSHKSAAHSDGRRWGATTDPDEIARDWARWPLANVGIVCGPASGLFVVEADTAAAHGVDGVANLTSLIEQNGGLPNTIEAESPSGSWHIYFRWPDGETIINSTGDVVPGVDVRGAGGMVVAPPSVRGDACYRWRNPPGLFDLADCPEWLLARCRKPKPRSTFNFDVGGPDYGDDERNLAEVEEALTYIDPDAGGYRRWLDVLMALHDEFGDAGLPAAERWSSRGAKYVVGEVEEKWRGFKPGGGIGIGTVFSRAREDGCDLGALRRKHRGAGADTSSDGAGANTSSEGEGQGAQEPGAKAADDLDFAFWHPRDLTTIPRTQFVYSDFYARGYTSLTIAEPKRGKSMLALAEAIDMASGLGLLTGVRRAPQRVLYYNAEDDQGVVDNRVAALLTHYNIPQEAIAGRLCAVSGVGRSNFYLATGENGKINKPLFEKLERFIADNRIDSATFDPLQDLTSSPETNEVFRSLLRRLRSTASTLSVAIGLVHHTRKVAPGMTATIDDARGGSSLRGSARFSRILVGMTKEEAEKAGVENHRYYLRVGDVESNLAPPSAEVNRWYCKVNVETPNGEHVGALESWTWPDAFDGVSRSEAYRVQRAIAARADNPPREHPQATDWAGKIVADVLGLDLADKTVKARVVQLLAGWIRTDVLRIHTDYSTRDSRNIQFIIVGENNLGEADG